MSKYTQEQLRAMAQEAIQSSPSTRFIALVNQLARRFQLSNTSVIKKIEELAQ